MVIYWDSNQNTSYIGISDMYCIILYMMLTSSKVRVCFKKSCSSNCAVVTIADRQRFADLVWMKWQR